jgi:LysR family hydrogen peroxide-inducible transcriptional activator
VIPTSRPICCPARSPRSREKSQGIDIHIREAVTPKLVQDVVEGRLDTAILALPASEPSLKEVALLTEDFVLVRPLSEEGDPVPPPEALRARRLLLLEEGHCFRDQALAVCNVPSVTPRDWMEGSSLGTLVQMVGAGIGVTLIPEMAVPVETRSAPVCVARFPGAQPTRTIGMVWRRTSPLARQLERVAEVVRQVAEA